MDTADAAAFVYQVAIMADWSGWASRKVLIWLAVGGLCASLFLPNRKPRLFAAGLGAIGMAACWLVFLASAKYKLAFAVRSVPVFVSMILLCIEFRRSVIKGSSRQ